MKTEKVIKHIQSMQEEISNLRSLVSRYEYEVKKLRRELDSLQPNPDAKIYRFDIPFAWSKEDNILRDESDPLYNPFEKCPEWKP